MTEFEQMNELPSSEDVSEDFVSGFVAVVGRPNVGKSTLLNAILGEKVAIVSPKPQTTRTRVQGILNRDDAQLVFVDTPGVCDDKTPLRKAMRRIGATAAADSDVTLVVIEPRGDTPEVSIEDLDLVSAARRGTGKVIVALNKVDRFKRKDSLLPWIATCVEKLEVETVIPISALRKDGLDVLLDALLAGMPKAPPMFPQDLHTSLAERFLCEELVREQLLMQTQQEIPHSAAVVIENFEDLRPVDDEAEGHTGLCRIEGRIYVERESQKAIVVGKRGARIRSISEAARKSIEELLGSRVYMRLTVHVEKEWTRTDVGVRRFGLDGEHGV